MKMAQDPYSVLGVPSTATDDEVKRAYKALAKKYHPDLNPNDPTAEAKMKQINAAYDEITAIRSGKKTYTQQRQNPYGGYTDYGHGYGNYTGYGHGYGNYTGYGQDNGSGGYTDYGRKRRTNPYADDPATDDPANDTPRYTRVTLTPFGLLRVIGKIILVQLILSFLLRACSVLAAAPFRYTDAGTGAKTEQTEIYDEKEVYS